MTDAEIAEVTYKIQLETYHELQDGCDPGTQTTNERQHSDHRNVPWVPMASKRINASSLFVTARIAIPLEV